MFGVVYLTFCTALRIASKIQDSWRDSKIKKETYNSSTGLYYDAKMRLYDSTMCNRQVILDWSNNGRTYTRDIKTYKILRDLTQEVMDKEYDYYNHNSDSGVTTIRWSVHNEENLNGTVAEIPIGTRYKDVMTGNIYVVRDFSKIGNSYLSRATKMKRDNTLKNKYIEIWQKHLLSKMYMDINTGLLVRVADGEYDKMYELRKKDNKLSEDEIKKEIQRQKERDADWINTYNNKKLDSIQKGLKVDNISKFYENYYHV